MALCREPTEAAAETVDSNPAPRKKSRCAYAVRLQARSRHSGLLSLLPLPPLSPVVDKAAVLSYNGKQKAPV